MTAMAMATDVVVVGNGAAGIAAARAAREAGATVTVVALGDGATALGSGVLWGMAREPFTRWAVGDGTVRAGGRYITVAGWLVAGPTGAVGALASLLDLETVPSGGMLGVVDLPVHPSWSARLVAQTLGARVIPWTGPGVPEGFLPAAASLDADGAPEAMAARLKAECAGLAAVLFPPVLGLVRSDVAARMTAALGVPAGETAGGAGDPPGVRMGRVLRAWLPPEVTVHRGTAMVDPTGTARVTLRDGTVLSAGAVVLATGGLTGAGLVFDGTLREVTAGLTVWTRGRQRVPVSTGAQRGADPARWFGEAPETRRAAGAGVRTDTDGRALDADGANPMAPWLFAAGDVVAARDPDATAGVTDALASGALAGTAAARHALHALHTGEAHG